MHSRLSSSHGDVERIDLLIKLGSEYGFDQNDSLYDLANELITLASRVNDKCAMATGYHFLGNFYYENRTDLDLALSYYERSLKIREKHCGEVKIASSYMQMGNVHSYRGQFDKSNDYYYKALGIYEKNRIDHHASTSHLNLAQNAVSREEFQEAKEHFQRALELEKEPYDYHNLGNIYNGIGTLYQTREVYDTALTYFQMAMEMYQRIDLQSGLAHGYNNIGIIHYYQGQEDSCMFYFKKSLEIRKEVGNVVNISQSYNNIGILLMYMENYPLAITYSDSALRLAEEYRLTSEISDAYLSLYEINMEYGEFYDAVTALKKYADYKDTLSSEASARATKEMNTKYRTLEKEKQIVQQDIDIMQQNDALERKNLIIWGATIGGILLVGLLIVVYNRHLVTRKQKHIIEDQKLLVEEKQAEIISSIKYAKRIQEALLKSEVRESEHLPDHFILYMPKDIVSGDFYWAHEKDHYLYLAAGDCTGHGVPGGFLTMLGTAFLNEIISEPGIRTPADILDKLRYKIVRELSQKGERGGSRDGMDISLIRIDLNTKEAVWSGANNPFWLIRSSDTEFAGREQETEFDKRFYSITGDKEPIGYFWEMTPFTDHQFKLEKGDQIYLFSDGYPDQFGGPKGRKYKYNNLRNTFLRISDMHMEEQKKFLHENIVKWMGDYEQIDDICVIGLRIS